VRGGRGARGGRAAREGHGVVLAQGVEGKYGDLVDDNNDKTNIGIGDNAGNTRRCGQCHVEKPVVDFDIDERGQVLFSCKICQVCLFLVH